MSKRPYKPTALRAFEGGRSHSLEKPEKVLEKEVKPYPKAPPIEKNLDKEAQKIAEELGPKLERLGLLTEIDGISFGILCQLASEIRKIWKSKNKDSFKTEKQIYPLFLKFAKEFGLTPLGRTGLTVNTDKEDEGADLLTK